MHYRTLGRTGLAVSEIGFGAWGIGGGMWGAADDRQSIAALEQALALGLNFIDTAFDYGDGHSERVVGQVVRAAGLKQGQDVYVASKIPPKNRTWPALKGSSLSEVFPNDYIDEYVGRSLENLGLSQIDLMQFHVWQDDWSGEEAWQEAIAKHKKAGTVRHWGISINDYQPENALLALKTGLIDVVQVIYNIFEQTPADTLFAACLEHNIGVIARVPLDEGGLTGAITPTTVFAKDDWRSHYFRGDRPQQLEARLNALAFLLRSESNPDGAATLAEAALRFCLSHPAVSTVIPGMRSAARAVTNCAFSDGQLLSAADLAALKAHAWPRNWYE
jgi:aryl-alcohol dehydrogenase-like predicted oxidoreductase